MGILDCLVGVLLVGLQIVGVYQIYFWSQRFVSRKKMAMSFETAIDDYFGYHPKWVWFYSGVYYLVIALVVPTLNSPAQFIQVSGSYVLLLFLQLMFFWLIPVETPVSWRRSATETNLSERFLRFIQSLDGRGNCFPSMHTSVSVLTALHLIANQPDWAFWPILYPITIALSALYTKQHYFVDVLAGSALGGVTFLLWRQYMSA